ncbi:MAG: hypothetical protein CMJ78_06370 [Planctomycetaceae bacterium]|nr:hypothetical protein [Planctomycetaceae bacterium]
MRTQPQPSEPFRDDGGATSSGLANVSADNETAKTPTGVPAAPNHVGGDAHLGDTIDVPIGSSPAADNPPTGETQALRHSQNSKTELIPCELGNFACCDAWEVVEWPTCTWRSRRH